MKRILILILLCLVLVMVFSTPVFAGSKGAVKADMVVHSDSGTVEMPAGTVVGSIILNTTGDGHLIAVVNLDDATLIGVAYDSLVHINGAKVLDQTAVDCLRVNIQGQATANYKVDLITLNIPDEATAINVSVVVRPQFSPNLTPCYVNGPVWKTEIVVPLK